MTTFEQLTPELVLPYLRSRPALATIVDTEAIAEVREVGDGNLNLVFIVSDSHGSSLVLKQSLPHVRTDPSWSMTQERSAREARVLKWHGDVDPEHVPALYDYDELNYVLAIENLSDHRVWRNELNDARVHGYAAAALGHYVARTAFHTSVLWMNPIDHKRLVAAAINPELAEITEDLVFTEPFIEHPHNSVQAENEADVRALRDDVELIAAVGIAKWRFMTTAQALIHGDLHTGSVFVRPSDTDTAASVRAFDSEFGFVGPIGFDVGAVWANLLIAAARAYALGEAERASQILKLVGEFLTSFEREFRALFPNRRDPRVWTESLLDNLIVDILRDAAATAGAKAIRRVVGFAKTSDLETLDPELRFRAARGVLRAGRYLLVHAATDSSRHTLHDTSSLILRDSILFSDAPARL